MPLSGDPHARRRQLANLQPGRGAGDGGVQRARQHGAYAQLPAERVGAKVREVAAAIGQDAPVRAEDGGLPAHDAVVVRQLAEVLCRLDDITDFITRRGFEDEDGKLRPVLEIEDRLRGRVLDLLNALGMTPAARARLGLDLARAVTAGDRLEEHLASRYGADALDGDAAAVAESIDVAALPADGELPDVEGDEHDEIAADDDVIDVEDDGE